MMFTTYYSLWR